MNEAVLPIWTKGLAGKHAIAAGISLLADGGWNAQQAQPVANLQQFSA